MILVRILCIMALSVCVQPQPQCPGSSYQEYTRHGRLTAANNPVLSSSCWAAAARVQPHDYDAWEGLFRVALTSGDIGAAGVASEALAHSGQLHNKLAMPHMARGRVLASLGRTMEAVESFQRTVALQPSSGATYNNLALLLKRVVREGQGSTDEVARLYRTAQALLPQNPHPPSNYGVFLAGEGRFFEAIEV